MSINAIVFGLTGFDTHPIVLEMKKRKSFATIKWFGIVEGADFNTYEFYKFKVDYDYRSQLPENYLDYMHETLGAFLISSSRRNEVFFNKKAYTLALGSTYEYLHHFWRYCYLVYDMILSNNINLVIIDGLPHTSVDLILYQAAKYFKIKTLLLYPLNIPNKFMYFSELDKRGVDFSLYYSDNARPQKNNYSLFKVDTVKSPFYMRDFSYLFYDRKKIFSDLIGENSYLLNRAVWSAKLSFLSNKFLAFIDQFLFPFVFLFSWKFFLAKKDPLRMQTLALTLLKFTTYNLFDHNWKKHAIKETNLNVPYVYFPLNSQPELTTECLGGHYIDIISAIEKVRVLIPATWKIYVKEHPIQYEFARDQVFFDRLMKIPQLCLMDRDFSTFDLIKNTQFVATINGTAGWEALQLGKNALIFGTIYYQGLPGVFRYSYDLTLEKIINYKINKEHFEIEVNKLISRMEDGVANSDHSHMVSEFDFEKNASKVSDFIERFFFELS